MERESKDHTNILEQTRVGDGGGKRQRKGTIEK